MVTVFVTCLHFRSAFFHFSNEERSKVKAKNPDYTVGDVAKELGKRWEVCTNRSKFEALAAKDKERYEKVYYVWCVAVIFFYAIDGSRPILSFLSSLNFVYNVICIEVFSWNYVFNFQCLLF